MRLVALEANRVSGGFSLHLLHRRVIGMLGTRYIPKQVAFRVEPAHIKPRRIAALLEFLVVAFDIGEAVVANGGERSVMLDLVLEAGQLLDYLLALFGARCVGAFRGGAVGIVNGLCLGGGRGGE